MYCTWPPGMYLTSHEHNMICKMCFCVPLHHTLCMVGLHYDSCVTRGQTVRYVVVQQQQLFILLFNASALSPHANRDAVHPGR